jgi:hypothetical protein
MKRVQAVIPLLFIVMLVSLGAPVLAAEKSVKIEFVVPGRIWDESQEISGVMSLTLSGRFIEKVPEYEKEEAGEYTYGPYEYEDSWEYIYERNGTLYKEELYVYYYYYYWANYYWHITKWYSPQPSYTGELIAIWEDGSTSTFTVDLSPSEIGKYFYEVEFYSEYHYAYSYAVYEWDGEKWVYIYGDSYKSGYIASGTFTGSAIGIYSIGKIQSTGKPLKGGLSFAEYKFKLAINGTWYWDDYTEELNYTLEQHGLWALGKFGPYYLLAYREIYVPSEMKSNPEHPKYVEQIIEFEELPTEIVKVEYIEG